MKHIRKYNESENNDNLVEYVEQCFIEFIDDGNCEMNWSVKEDQCNIKIKVYEDEMRWKNNDHELSLDEMKKAAITKLRYIERLENIFQKLKEGFPHLQYLLLDKEGIRIDLDIALDSSRAVLNNPSVWKNI